MLTFLFVLGMALSGGPGDLEPLAPRSDSGDIVTADGNDGTHQLRLVIHDAGDDA